MKALSIIESAYRATLEEQDDTIVWLNHAMKAAGASLSVLLRGNAVNYPVRDQSAEGLSFGSWKQTQPPRLADDIAGLVRKGIDVYVVAEDLAERGIAADRLATGVQPAPLDIVVDQLADGAKALWH